MLVSIPLIFARVAKDELPLTGGTIGHGGALSHRLPPVSIRFGRHQRKNDLFAMKSVVGNDLILQKNVRCRRFDVDLITLRNLMAWAVAVQLPLYRRR